MATTQMTEWLPAREFLARYQGIIGRTAFYEGVRSGDIPSIRVGKKILVPSDAFDQRLMAQSAKGEIDD